MEERAVDENELRELQDPETWESTDNDKRPPVKSGRAIVSVAFSRNDFELVSEVARESGMKTSEFIRDAAIRRALEKTAGSFVVSVSGAVRNEYSLNQLRGARLNYSYTTHPDQTFILATS